MARAIVRKVLATAAHGRCVVWPKTEWEAVPAPGAAGQVTIDGQPVAITVTTEDCNCRANGWHEHRFLCFAEGVGPRVGRRVTVTVGDGPVATSAGPSLVAMIDEVNDAALFGQALSKTRIKTLGKLLGRQQGLPGSYPGLFALFGDELAAGYRFPTGERIATWAGSRHICGEEALRALVLLDQWEQPTGQTIARAAIERAVAAMEPVLESSPDPGRFCCNQCSIALWRVWATGGYSRGDQHLAAGLAWLAQRRDGQGGWRGLPFYYTFSALVAAGQRAAAELSYVRPRAERLLARGCGVMTRRWWRGGRRCWRRSPAALESGLAVATADQRSGGLTSGHHLAGGCYPIGRVAPPGPP
ncbi:MAG: hypothetical protein IT204_10855 [Fimbriimonadaceae bacterium]|nr:hypothetical protein [Fimbriimonadaceae bacterium]